MSSKDLKAITIIDLETTCWDNIEDQGDQLSDITEIGIAKLNLETLEISKAPRLFVVPERSTVSKFCTELTGITQDMVSEDNGAVKFYEAIRRVKETVGKGPWASYGDFDRKMFQRQCEDYKLDYPFGPRHLNVKSLLAYVFGWSREKGMDGALKELGLELEGRHHCGVDDAYNIAKLFVEVIKRVRGQI